MQRIEVASARQDRIEGAIRTLLPAWSLAPVAAAIQALRGIAMLAAVTLVAEIGDFGRFTSPRQLMAWLGLVPKEHSSGRKVARGNITKAGNARARRVLVEGAWTYRLPARMGEEIIRRNRACRRPSRRSPGRHRCDCASAIAGCCTQASRKTSSPWRSLESWQHSPGRSPAWCRFRCNRRSPHRQHPTPGNRERSNSAPSHSCAAVDTVAGQGNPRRDSATHHPRA